MHKNSLAVGSMLPVENWSLCFHVCKSDRETWSCLMNEWIQARFLSPENKTSTSLHRDVVLMQHSFLSRRERFLERKNIIFSKEASAPDLLICWCFALISTSNATTKRIFESSVIRKCMNMVCWILSELSNKLSAVVSVLIFTTISWKQEVTFF